MWSNGFLQRIDVVPCGRPAVLAVLGLAAALGVLALWSAEVPGWGKAAVLVPALLSLGQAIRAVWAWPRSGYFCLGTGADGRCRWQGQATPWPAASGRAWRCGFLAAFEVSGPGGPRQLIMVWRPAMTGQHWRRLSVRLRHPGTA